MKRFRGVFLPLLTTAGFLASTAQAQEASWQTLVVEAGTDGAYVTLGDPATIVDVSGNPRDSAAWDLAFFNTDIVVNGGEAGPGGLTATCLCANADIEDDELQLLTPVTEEDNFAAVSQADVPPAPESWGTSALAEDEWYRYNIAMQHRIWPTYNIYLIHKGGETYKVQFLGYYGEDDAPRVITFRYARL